MSAIIPTSWHTHVNARRPFVTLKAAATLDGKIATASGESKWITGAAARAHAHLLRSEHQGLAVGINTVLADNPRLTVRRSADKVMDVDKSLQPARIVFDSRAHIPEGAALLNAADGVLRIVVSGCDAPQQKLERLQALGIAVIRLSQPRPAVEDALPALRAQGIQTLLVEGGAQLHASMIEAKCADALVLYLSGAVMGDAAAPSWSGQLQRRTLTALPKWVLHECSQIGDDLCILGRFDSA